MLIYVTQLRIPFGNLEHITNPSLPVEQHRADPARGGRVRAVAAVRGARAARDVRDARRALAEGGRGAAPAGAHALLSRGLPRRAAAREGDLLYIQAAGQ